MTALVCDRCGHESRDLVNRGTFLFCVNRAECEDRKKQGPPGRLRPHSIAGWWQVWTGDVCVALLRPEDVQAIPAYENGWRNAIEAAVRECEGERAACERHHKAQPRRLNHKVGMQIATVCAHRVGQLLSRP